MQRADNTCKLDALALQADAIKCSVRRQAGTLFRTPRCRARNEDPMTTGSCVVSAAMGEADWHGLVRLVAKLKVANPSRRHVCH